MTSLLKLASSANSNGDIAVTIKCGQSIERHLLAPGDKLDQWISTGHEIEAAEFHPQKSPPAPEAAKFGELADFLIEKEVTVQDKMWGTANERADASDGQMLAAALATAAAIDGATKLGDRKAAFGVAERAYYPKGWTGFRDYGSDIANLVVAAAFLRSEIKRRLANHEDYTRAKRGEPYKGDQPYMSSEEAGA